MCSQILTGAFPIQAAQDQAKGLGFFHLFCKKFQCDIMCNLDSQDCHQECQYKYLCFHFIQFSYCSCVKSIKLKLLVISAVVLCIMIVLDTYLHRNLCEALLFIMATAVANPGEYVSKYFL